jgi:hypothetical protein
MAFGTNLYKRAWYCDIVETDSSEMKGLIRLLSDFKQGRFQEMDHLSALLRSSSDDVRKYALQVFVDVCSHAHVPLLEGALQVSKTLDETRGILLRLGQTLSLEAIPILFEWWRELDDFETDAYVCQSLRTILPLGGVDEYSIRDKDAEALYKEAVSSLDRSSYYYRGRPVFVGDVTKELINACTVAYKERTPCSLGMQPQILSNFSGVKCPVAYGEMISDVSMEQIFSYVKTLAQMSWKKGAKYFFHNEIQR